MRVAEIQGTEKRGEVRFTYCPEIGEHGQAYLRRSPEKQDWYWWVEGVFGVAPKYETALRQVTTELLSRGIQPAAKKPGLRRIWGGLCRLFYRARG